VSGDDTRSALVRTPPQHMHPHSHFKLGDLITWYVVCLFVASPPSHRPSSHRPFAPPSSCHPPHRVTLSGSVAIALVTSPPQCTASFVASPTFGLVTGAVMSPPQRFAASFIAPPAFGLVLSWGSLGPAHSSDHARVQHPLNITHAFVTSLLHHVACLWSGAVMSPPQRIRVAASFIAPPAFGLALSWGSLGPARSSDHARVQQSSPPKARSTPFNNVAGLESTTEPASRLPAIVGL
jgi:hypothetical protein